MGNLLSAPVTTKETHVGTTADGLEFGVSSMQGWRIHMEDAHITETELYALKNSERYVLDGHSMFVVFDGHGGSYAALYAGENLVRVLATQAKFAQYAQFNKERSAKEESMDETQKASYAQEGLELLEGALTDAFLDIDREIALALKGQIAEAAVDPFSDLQRQPAATSDAPSDGNTETPHVPSIEEETESGTTACAVVITPEWIVCANTGDSRAVFSRQGNKVVPLSFDHKPDDEEEERRIRAAGGYVAGGRVEGDLAVSRGLGDFRFKRFDVVMAGNDEKQVPDFKPGDQKVSPIPDMIVQNRDTTQDEFILVACDGIWDVQNNLEAVKMVAQMFQEGESDLGLVCEEVSALKML